MAGATEATLVLPHSPRAPALARKWLAEQMIDWQRPEDVNTAMLVVGELVTNAITYATGEPVLVVDEIDGALRCAVHHDSSSRPELIPPYSRRVRARYVARRRTFPPLGCLGRRHLPPPVGKLCGQSCTPARMVTAQTSPWSVSDYGLVPMAVVPRNRRTQSRDR